MFKWFKFFGIAAGAAVVFVAAVMLARPNVAVPLRPEEVTVRREVPHGVIFTQLMAQMGVATDTSLAILKAAQPAYDLAKIVSGKELALVYATSEGWPLKRLAYYINADERLVVERNPESVEEWTGQVEQIPYEIKERIEAGAITTSLYEAIVDANIDERLALALAETFAWQIDFAADIRAGDTFKVIYEERFLDGRYVMPGKILAAEFVNDGTKFRGYYFEGPNTKAGHYDENGKSLQKMFLKSPLQYKYISSGFSYGRVNPITKEISSHRGIDYAAPAGTPAVSVGDGTVIQAGWNGPYGVSVKVRHNETYQTLYGHFSRLAKGIARGAKVAQGQVVGYVGSTGDSTGPHLHYEMYKFGARVNPFKVEIPDGGAVADGDKAAFQETIARFVW